MASDTPPPAPQAATWGCRCAVLHCNPSNTAAAALYASLGYRRTALEALWVSYWQGRGGDRCHLWVKRLPTSSPEAHPAAGAAQLQQGDLQQRGPGTRQQPVGLPRTLPAKWELEG